MNRCTLAACLLLAASSSCTPSQTPPKNPEPQLTSEPGQPSEDPAAGQATTSEPALADVSLADVGLEAAAMNRSVDPCTDFYEYACGGWIQSTEIPVDRPRYNRFAEIQDRNQLAVRQILEEAASAGGKSPAEAKLGAFYGACMDEAAIEASGTKGIADLLATARGVKTQADIMAAIGKLHRHGIFAAFSAEPEGDFKDSRRMILFLDSSGLGLPDRDYYFKEERAMAEARAFYRGHVERMFRLLGMNARAAKKAADDVVRIETELAKVTMTKTERSDISKLYNKVDKSGLKTLAPRYDWDAYLAAIELPALTDISVTTPPFMARVGELITEVKPAAWSNYLQWQIVHALAGTLPKAFVDEDFALTKQITGQPEQQPRWKRCVQATERALGELVGERFVARMFAGDSKTQAETMVRAISEAFQEEVQKLAWMSGTTKEQALAKLRTMSNLIGHPVKWRPYDFEVSRESHAANVTQARQWNTLYELAKAGKPVDRTQWLMTPQTVNAYYTPIFNQMVFPAGILQPPFFGASRSIAANLGGMGVVVGHELTHGFDDTGSQFDGDGNMRNWWQPEDAKQFSDKGQCLINEYNRFEVLPGATVNGKLTLGENIADLGGVKLALRAYRNLRKDAKTRYRAEGLSEDQQFFLGYAQAWCSESREAETRRLLIVDSHSPPRYRVIGALRNTPEFARVWSCEEGTPMNPEAICEVW